MYDTCIQVSEFSVDVIGHLIAADERDGILVLVRRNEHVGPEQVPAQGLIPARNYALQPGVKPYVETTEEMLAMFESPECASMWK